MYAVWRRHWWITSRTEMNELANFCPENESEMKLGLKRAIARMVRKLQLIHRLMLSSPLFMGKF